MGQIIKPPRLMLWFFRWFCQPDFREDIEGDLLERFHAQAITQGVTRARWLFARDVLRLFRIGLIRGLRNRQHDQFFNMNTFSWIKMAMVNLLLILVILSPFLPGPPNRIVIGLSAVGQATGFMGLILIPIGVAWIILELRKRKTKNQEVLQKPIFSLSVAATVVAAIFYLLFAAAVFTISGVSLGILVLLVGAFLLTMVVKGIIKLKNQQSVKFNPTPAYLILIPLTALFTRLYIMTPLIDRSRDLTIQKSQELIVLIEDFKNKTGQYPSSIDALVQNNTREVPKPHMMGVLNFRYNKIDDYYSLSFSQWLEFGSLEEIVLYDKNNISNNLKGDFAKYDYGFDLCRIKGAIANYGTRHNNWRYYHLD